MIDAELVGRPSRPAARAGPARSRRSVSPAPCSIRAPAGPKCELPSRRHGALVSGSDHHVGFVQAVRRPAVLPPR